jgi:hypothetical protein
MVKNQPLIYDIVGGIAGENLLYIFNSFQIGQKFFRILTLLVSVIDGALNDEVFMR